MSIQCTNGEAIDIIENEGIGYAVLHYCDGSNFEDYITCFLWDAAQNSLQNLVDYLELKTGREID